MFFAVSWYGSCMFNANLAFTINLPEMKKLLYVAAIALGATACSSENDLQDTLYNVVESSANMAIDSLHQAADKELERHTGIDSLATIIRTADTIDVEREVERTVKRKIIEELSK